jgi:alginate O-acetyltransferase complex protein AlgI
LPGAIHYYARLFGLSGGGELAALVAGLVWQPLFIVTLLVAVLIVWLGPTTISWTHKLTAPKATWALGVFWLSALMLGVQKFNPFIYFIF